MRSLFPDLSGRWTEVNLDTEAKYMFPSNVYRGHNPLLDPSVCKNFVEDFHKRNDADFSYGGYLEDRSNLWRGHYQEKTGAFTHLGVDFNVPAGTRVAAPRESEVVYSFADPDRDVGWGGIVVMRTYDTKDHYLLGHMRKDGLPQVGSKVPRGVTIGYVANYPENGNWYPHLHMQGLSKKLLFTLEMDFRSVDGYSAWRGDLSELYPDPMLLLKKDGKF
jgi:murein DD-endopeptidase MepM/ murein hydrolase activator NlpD